MKKKVLAISLTVSLLAIAALGATLAYFTDTKEVANTFTMGNVKIDLLEYIGVSTTTPVTAAEFKNILPGDVLKKAPYIKNTGSNAAFVFAKVTMPRAEDLNKLFGTVEDTSYTALINLWNDSVLTYPAVSNWEVVKNPTVSTAGELVFYFGYKEAVAPNTETGYIFSEIKMPTSIEQVTFTNTNAFEMKITGYAIQASGLTYGTAKTSLPAEFGFGA